MAIKLEVELKKLGLSQARLAAATGTMHPSSISVLIQGWRKPGERQRTKIETAMKEAGWNGEGDLFEEVE
jgi:hypothetical protein